MTKQVQFSSMSHTDDFSSFSIEGEGDNRIIVLPDGETKDDGYAEFHCLPDGTAIAVAQTGDEADWPFGFLYIASIPFAEI